MEVMRATSPHDPKMTTRLQLLLLLIAAMACVATMLASFVDGHHVWDVTRPQVWSSFEIGLDPAAVILPEVTP